MRPTLLKFRILITNRSMLICAKQQGQQINTWADNQKTLWGLDTFETQCI